MKFTARLLHWLAFPLPRLTLVLALMVALCLPLTGSAEESAAVARRNPSVANMTPPSVNDVLVQLRQARADLGSIEEARRLVKQDIPGGASVDEQIAFLTRRANAADDVGDLSLHLADRKRVAEFSRGTRDEAEHFFNLGYAEVVFGDIHAGIAAFQHVITLLEKNNLNQFVETAALSLMAYTRAVNGQTTEAAESLGKAKWLLNRFQMYPGGWRAFLPSQEGVVNFAEGRLLISRGKWQEAEATLRHAVAKNDEWIVNAKKIAQSGMVSNQFMVKQAIAGGNFFVTSLGEHLIRQGKLDEAELLLRDLLSVNLQRDGRNSIRTASTLVGLAGLLTERGRYREALQVISEADEIQRVLGVSNLSWISFFATRVKLEAFIAMQSWGEAVDLEDAFRGRIAAAGLEEFGSFSPGLAIGLILSGRSLDARVRLEKYIKIRADAMGAGHYQVAEARGVKAMAMTAAGDRKGALAEYASAGRTLIEHASQDGEAQSRGIRAMVRRQILEAWLDALAEDRDIPDAAAQAFRIADVLHIGKTQHALAQSAARAAANQADLGELIRLDQDSQAEEVTLYGTLLRLSSQPGDKQLPKVMADMRLRIGSLEKERHERQAVIEKRFPAYANLVNPRPPELAAARAVLKPNEALISIFSTEQATYVWAFKATGDVSFVRAPLTRNAIGQIVTSLRKAVDPGDADIANGLPAFDLDAAYQLYANLLLPAANGWKGADSLLVVANGALSQLPLALLPTAKVTLGKDSGARYSAYRAVPWLIRDAAVTQLPSVNSLVALRQLPQSNPRQREFVGFGDPEFSVLASAVTAKRSLRNLAVARFREPQAGAVPAGVAASSGKPAAWAPYDSIPPLPDTRDEILALAKVLNADLQRDVFLGKQASTEAVKKTNFSQTRIVAFATHGLLAGEFPGVDQPSLALANPGNGQHGLLTLEDILSLKLNADWVVLSACNTAGGDGAGAEAISGLGRGFFYAGTRSLLATHWPVESVSAQLLVTGAFAFQAATPTLARAQALRQSMLALMEQHATDGGFAYAHPLFWGPYALFGDGGR